MKKFVYIILIFTFNNHVFGQSVDHPELYSQTKPYVFKVKTSQNANSSKASYGTGFVVDKDGLFEAKVIDFSVINDLALIKINRKFKDSMKLERELPKRGEKIFSIGLPKDLNMSIVEGTFNGELKRGLYERFLMSTPVNSGMSGGPSVDNNGNVIGINVSILRDSENISFSVPSEKALELLNYFHKNGAALKRKDYDRHIEKQLKNIEKSLLKSMKTNLSKSKVVGGFEIAAPSKDVKCWTANDKSRKNTFKFYKQSCRLKSSAFIQRRLYSGTYKLSYTALHNIKRNKLQFSSIIKSYLNSNSLKPNDHNLQTFREELTKYSCDEDIWVNDNNISFKVTYCLSTYLRYKNIYRLFFKAATINNKNKGLVVKLSADGFTKNGIFDFIKYHLNNIKSVN